MQNYFEIFALDTVFDIDNDKLQSSYQEQIAKHHPDKFASGSDREKTQALQNTSLINTAYNTLNNPLDRATYLLDLNGINAFDEKDTQMDVDFFMAQIEYRETLESLEKNKDEMKLDDFIESISNKIKNSIKELSAFFANNEFNQAKNLVRELKFYIQLNNKAKALMDEIL